MRDMGYITTLTTDVHDYVIVDAGATLGVVEDWLG